MFKKMWLMLAASAVVMSAQVFADVATDVTTDVEEVAQAIVLAQDLVDGKITAAELTAIEQLQANRNSRSKVIRTALIVATVAAVGGVTAYFAYNHFFKKEEAADNKGGKKAVEKDKPAVEKDKPAVEKDKPAVEKDKPADEKDKPADEKDKPADEKAPAKKNRKK